MNKLTLSTLAAVLMTSAVAFAQAPASAPVASISAPMPVASTSVTNTAVVNTTDAPKATAAKHRGHKAKAHKVSMSKKAHKKHAHKGKKKGKRSHRAVKAA